MKATVVETDKVYFELLRYAKENLVTLSEIDFDILEVVTTVTDMVTLEELEGDLSREYILRLLEKRQILISQTYIIDIFEKIEDEIKIDISLLSNKQNTKIYLRLNGVHEYNDSFILKLKQEIKKKQIMNGFLVDVFDIKDDKYIKEIYSKLKVNEKYDFGNKNFLISESVEPVKEIDDKIIKHYKKEKTNDKDRGFIIETKKDQLLLEYIKAKDGKEGLTCKGFFIEKKKGKVSFSKGIKAGAGILFEENEDFIKYTADEVGYLDIKGTTISIKKDMEIKEVSFKKTGSIDSSNEAMINMNVTETNPSLDSIHNASIKVQTIRIAGNVGHGSAIIAEDASVEGQVHKGGTIEAKKIYVNRLKGVATGEDITVSSLEQGKIRGKQIYIGLANGGVIIGDDVYIKVLKSNTTIMAANSINIEIMEGEDNKLIINPLVRMSKYELDSKILKIKALEVDVLKINHRLTVLIDLLKKKRPEHMELSKKIKMLQERKLMVTKMFKDKHKQYRDLVDEAKLMAEEKKHKEILIKALKEELDAVSAHVTKSVIKVESDWNLYNDVIFKIGGGRELEFRCRKKEKIEVVSVVRNRNNELEISFKK